MVIRRSVGSTSPSRNQTSDGSLETLCGGTPEYPVACPSSSSSCVSALPAFCLSQLFLGRDLCVSVPLFRLLTPLPLNICSSRQRVICSEGSGSEPRSRRHLLMVFQHLSQLILFACWFCIHASCWRTSLWGRGLTTLLSVDSYSPALCLDTRPSSGP